MKDVILSPTESNPQNFSNIVIDAMHRNAIFRMLLFKNQIEYASSLVRYPYQFADKIKEAAAKATGAGSTSRVVVDGRCDREWGSIHQKFWTASINGSLHAVVGGIDVAYDRWDVVEHNDPPARQEKEKAQSFTGWIDRTVKVRGPAAADIANFFVWRWNSPVPNDLGWDRDNYTRDEPTARSQERQGTLAIQLLTTWPQRYSMAFVNSIDIRADPFAPKGDVTYGRAVVKAMSFAEKLIYIEDQYAMFTQEMFDALERRLKQVPDLKVVALYAGYSINAMVCEKFQYRLFGVLKEKFPDQIHTYVRTDNAYVHSKMVVVDDQWIAIGSANLGYRSYTFDGEIGVAIWDTKTEMTVDGFRVNAFAHDARVRAMAEVTGLNVSSVKASGITNVVQMLKVFSSSIDIKANVPSVNALDHLTGLSCGQLDPHFNDYFK
eukprot:TRINITY_DN12095_c0_g1_i1.p1 TRINITY_DN12095_c0_g1~~TRINITY_DN12095_c0_g1_i1.p1  ORF type:complete len:435 (+),score=66.22 TRINITY_DN12095_c0_g1_i1:206-1510(+)